MITTSQIDRQRLPTLRNGSVRVFVLCYQVIVWLFRRFVHWLFVVSINNARCRRLWGGMRRPNHRKRCLDYLTNRSRIRRFSEYLLVNSLFIRSTHERLANWHKQRWSSTTPIDIFVTEGSSFRVAERNRAHRWIKGRRLTDSSDDEGLRRLFVPWRCAPICHRSHDTLRKNAAKIRETVLYLKWTMCSEVVGAPVLM